MEISGCTRFWKIREIRELCEKFSLSGKISEFSFFQIIRENSQIFFQGTALWFKNPYRDSFPVGSGYAEYGLFMDYLSPEAYKYNELKFVQHVKNAVFDCIHENRLKKINHGVLCHSGKNQGNIMEFWNPKSVSTLKYAPTVVIGRWANL